MIKVAKNINSAERRPQRGHCQHLRQQPATASTPRGKSGQHQKEQQHRVNTRKEGCLFIDPITHVGDFTHTLITNSGLFKLLANMLCAEEI